MTGTQERRNLRMLLILASIATAFFLGIIIKIWLFGI